MCAALVVILCRHRRREFEDAIDVEDDHELAVEAMHDASQLLVGEHDFQGFGSGRTTIRKMERVECHRSGDCVLVDLVANAFLKGMVRNIVGTLIRVGSGEIPSDRLERILQQGDRALAGPSAPARGLCLMAVYYREADASEYL